MYVIKEKGPQEWILTKTGSKKVMRIFQTRVEAEMYMKMNYSATYEVEERQFESRKPKNKKKKILIAVAIIVALLAGIGAILWVSINGIKLIG